MKITMYSSLLSSIIIQIMTGLIEFSALFFKVPLQYTFLKQMMMLELFVQFIEGSFYIYWLYHFKMISNITPNRYFDWVVTTPTMLINLIFYLIFLKYKDTETLDFFTLFKSEFSTISIVLLLNWMMLLFGYLGETSVIPVSLGVSLGFIPFFIYYYIIYEKYALTNDGLIMFFYFLFFWSLYGLVAVLPYKLKNMCYNILDLFAKNFFGLFLTYSLFTNSIQ
jgi:bacteriorhodopsin